MNRSLGLGSVQIYTNRKQLHIYIIKLISSVKKKKKNSSHISALCRDSRGELTSWARAH